jgi:hypothetical protein
MINTDREIPNNNFQITNKLEITNPKYQSFEIWDLLRQFAPRSRVFFAIWNFSFYAFLFKAILNSIEIADFSIFSFPDMVSITAVVSETSEIFP